MTSPDSSSYCCSELEKLLQVVVPESISSDTEQLPAFSFQHHFTTISVRGDIAKFIIPTLCKSEFVYFV